MHRWEGEDEHTEDNHSDIDKDKEKTTGTRRGQFDAIAKGRRINWLWWGELKLMVKEK